MLLGSGSKRSWEDWELASSFVWEVTGKLRENTAGFGCWLEGHGRLRKRGEKRGVGMGKVWVKELEEMAPEFRMRAD